MGVGSVGTHGEDLQDAVIGPPVSQHERQPAMTQRPYMAAILAGRYRAERQASMARPPIGTTDSQFGPRAVR
jgi:hypothetical protein